MKCSLLLVSSFLALSFNFLYCQTNKLITDEKNEKIQDVSYLIQSNDPICAGETLILNYYGRVLDPSCVCHWTGPNGFYAKGDRVVIPRAGGNHSGIYHLRVECADYVLTDQIRVQIFGANEASIIPSGEYLCEGETITLTAYPDGNYLWSTGERGKSITVTKGGKYSVSVTKTRCGDGFASIDVKESDKPEASINAQPSVSACVGDTILLEALPKEKSFRYLWSTKERSSFIKVTKSGTYTVIITNENDCKDTSTVEILIDKPEVKITGKSPICYGEPVTLTAIPYIAGLNYYWSTGENAHSITVNHGGNYRVIAENPLGCSDTAFFNIVEYPRADFSIVPSAPTTFCIGEQISLTATPEKRYKYLWSTGETASKIYVHNTGMYYLTTRDSLLCTYVDSIYIQVNNKPFADIRPQGPYGFCPGDSVIVVSVEQKPDYKYLWSNGDTKPQTTLYSQGKYKLWVENEFGCIDSSEIVVYEKKVPKFAITGNNKFCDGESSIISVDADEPQYLWSTGDTTKAIIVNKAGKYYVTVTSTDGCAKTDSIEIEVYKIPQVKIIGKTTICKNEKSAIATDAEFASYQWSNGATTREIEVGSAGNYSVDVVDFNGCKAKATIKITVFETLAENKSETDYGRICAGEALTKKFVLTNTGADAFEVEKISILKRADIFKLDNPDLPFKLEPQKDLVLNIDINTNKPGIYLDSIILIIEKPCPLYLSYPLHVEINPKIISSLKDVSGKIGDTNFYIPLYAKLNWETDTIMNMDFSAQIKLSSTMFYPNDKFTSSVTDKQRIINVIGNATLSKDEAVIENIYGTILLNFEEYSPVQIEKIEWTDPNACQKTNDASIAIDDICIKDLRLIEVLTSGSFSVKQINYGLEVKVTSQESGNHILSFYTVEGLKVAAKSFSMNNKNETLLLFDNSMFPNGMLYGVLQSPTKIISKPFLFIK